MTNLAVINEFAIDLTDEIAVQEAMIDAEYNEILLLESIVDLQEELYKNKAVQKVFAEKGSYDDMAFLFVEAENDVAEDKKGIFQKFVELIKKIATNIGNAVKALFGIKVDDNEMIEVDEDFANPQNRSALSNFANKLGGAKGIAGIAAAALAVGGLTFLFVKSTKKTQMKAKDAKAAAEQADKDKNVISSFVSKFLGDPNASSEMNKQEDKSGHTVSDIVKQALSWINTKVNAILGKFKSLLPGGNKDEAAPQSAAAPASNNGGEEGSVTVQGSKFLFSKDGHLINAFDKDGNIIKNPDKKLLSKAWSRFKMSPDVRAQKEANEALYGGSAKKSAPTSTQQAAQPAQNTAPAQNAKPQNSNQNTSNDGKVVVNYAGKKFVFDKNKNGKLIEAKTNAGNKLNFSNIKSDEVAAAKKLYEGIVAKEAMYISELMGNEITIIETEEGFEIPVTDEVMEAFIECMNNEEVTTEAADDEISMTESLFGTLAALEAEKDPEFNELKSLIDSL